MIPSGSAFLRVAALGFGFVVIQVSGVSQIQVLGASANLVPLFVAAVALYAGSVPGAAAGFGVGLLLDLAVGGDVGASSLVLTAVGYGLGRYREVRDPAHSLAPIPIAAVATLTFGLGFAAVSFMLSADADVSALVLRDLLVTTILNVLLALPAFVLVRRVLRPVLVVDPLERRRRRRGPRPTGPIGLRGMGGAGTQV
jgi:rod shape-determining protein MreD